MNTAPITAENILENYIQLSKNVLGKETLSDSENKLVEALMEVKDQFVATEKPKTHFIDIRPNVHTRQGVKIITFEIRILLTNYSPSLSKHSDRVLVLGLATEEVRPDNISVICVRQIRGVTHTLQYKEMTDGGFNVQDINDGLNYLMFGLMPPEETKEEVKRVLH